MSKPLNAKTLNTDQLGDPGAGILWVTNAAPPYRRGVWRAISAMMPIRVALLESNSRLSKDGRRGSDWLSGDLDIEVVHPRVWRVARGERVFYTLVSRLAIGSDRPRAIMLGGWESPAYWQVLVAAKVRRIRVIGFYESTLNTNRYSRGPIAWARRRFFRLIDGVVVPGPAAREAVASFGVPPTRIFEGFNAVDVEQFHAASVERTTHKSAGHRFLYVGQLIERKNLIRMIDAYSVQRREEDSLTIVGAGEQKAELIEHARLQGVASSIHFREPVANRELPGLLTEFDTLVLPSTEEVWGLVVNEALASGLHVVVSTRAGVCASVSWMDGVYTTDTDANSIASAMSLSRQDWSGPIREPAILAYGPQRFAEVFLAALAPADGNRKK